MDSKTDTQVLATLAGVPQFAPLIRAFRDGSISIAPEGPVGENEVVIGHLDEIEQALYSASALLSGSANEMVAIGKKSLQESMLSGENPDDDHAFSLLQLNHGATTSLADALTKIMWYGIKSRLGDEATKYNTLSLRADNKIVGSNSGSVDVHIRVIAIGLD